MNHDQIHRYRRSNPKKSILLSPSKLKSFSESESGIFTLSITEHFLAAVSDKKRAAKSDA